MEWRPNRNSQSCGDVVAASTGRQRVEFYKYTAHAVNDLLGKILTKEMNAGAYTDFKGRAVVGVGKRCSTNWPIYKRS